MLYEIGKHAIAQGAENPLRRSRSHAIARIAAVRAAQVPELRDIAMRR